MDPLNATAAAGIRARMESLDLLANNLANSGTPGFKADREAYRLYQSRESEGETPWSPVLESHVTDLSQGQLTETSTRTDLAISGEGFLVVEGPGGPLLTRNGKLHVSSDGKLLSAGGYELVTVEPRRIRVDPLLPFEVAADGSVTQRGAPLGRLRIAGVAEGVQAAKREGTYFSLNGLQLRDLPAERFEIRQGYLESSNFSPAEASVKLIGVLRQFEMLQRAMQLGGEMGRRAVEDVARVTP